MKTITIAVSNNNIYLYFVFVYVHLDIKFKFKQISQNNIDILISLLIMSTCDSDQIRPWTTRIWAGLRHENTNSSLNLETRHEVKRLLQHFDRTQSDKLLIQFLSKFIKISFLFDLFFVYKLKLNDYSNLYFNVVTIILIN